jgi:hypothetical protein
MQNPKWLKGRVLEMAIKINEGFPNLIKPSKTEAINFIVKVSKLEGYPMSLNRAAAILLTETNKKSHG